MCQAQVASSDKKCAELFSPTLASAGASCVRWSSLPLGLVRCRLLPIAKRAQQLDLGKLKAISLHDDNFGFHFCCASLAFRCSTPHTAFNLIGKRWLSMMWTTHSFHGLHLPAFTVLFQRRDWATLPHLFSARGPTFTTCGSKAPFLFSPVRREAQRSCGSPFSQRGLPVRQHPCPPSQKTGRWNPASCWTTCLTRSFTRTLRSSSGVDVRPNERLGCAWACEARAPSSRSPLASLWDCIPRQSRERSSFPN